MNRDHHTTTVADAAAFERDNSPADFDGPTFEDAYLDAAVSAFDLAEFTRPTHTCDEDGTCPLGCEVPF